MCLDLHRHDEFSSFDGFGKALDLARLAKEQGLTSLGIANHGNMNGIVEHYLACKQEEIKPILGVEAYFQPNFDRKNPKRDTFHLCLFAYNLEGYKNLNRIMTTANLKQKYYKPIVDFKLLRKYSEGVICTSGCIASFISQLIVKGRKSIVEKALKEFISIYGKEDYYIEIQPYKLSERTPEEKNLQEKVNIELIKLAEKHDLKMVLTSDSHYGNKNDYDTYLKMHEIKSSDDFAGNTYEERYMPFADDLAKRFMKMHGKDFKNPKKILNKCLKGLKDIEDKTDGDILDKLNLELPSFSDKDSKELLWENIKKGLKEKGKYNKKYVKVNREEYDVIVHHGYEDYFLIVQDYVKWAKAQGIKVGPGRGSVCNSSVAYALDITEVDSVYFDLDFKRFLRMDKKKLPDIDLDFETSRRDEVIEYIVKKYKGHAAQICSYGLYKEDNLLNDLFKVCGVEHKNDQIEIKKYVKSKVDDGKFDYEKVSRESMCRHYNKSYDNIILHFSKMYKKVRYIGTHAAGVAVVGGNLLDYTPLESRGNKEKGTYKIATAYDLNNLESINVIKFDMLGLRTLSITKELEEMTGECFSYEWLEDEEIYDYFREGKTDGVFQFEKDAAKNILINIHTDCFDDVVAASSLNRPGPLSLKMPDHYAHGKLEGNFGNEPWAEYTNRTYGTIVYQEQIMRICVEIGQMDYGDADKIMKFLKGGQIVESVQRRREAEEKELRDKFVKGAMKTTKMSKQEANDLFDSLIVYTFNQGHGVGYSLISYQQMYFKVKYPELFWYVTLKYAANDNDLFRLKIQAVKEGNIILLPHVNYESKYAIVQVEGENALAEGLSNVKGVGPKAAIAIEEEKKKNGKFKNKQNFLDRVPKQQVNAGVIRALEEAGALLFEKKTYFERVKKYNTELYTRGMGR